VAAVSTALTWVVSGYAIYKHLQHYSCPAQQKLIIRLLFTCPLYSLCSCLSLRLTASALYFETVRDVYEAFIIYTFLVLILEYAGGESACVSKMQARPPLTPPVPCCWLPAKPRTARLLRECKQGTLQFVVIKPLVALVSLVMMGVGKYYTTSYQTVMLTVYNISYTLALYYLLVFYLATREVIGRFNPIRKFAAVKAVVFATYYQTMIIKVAPGMSTERAQQWSDFLLCLEMILFALVLGAAFPFMDYHSAVPGASMLENARSVIAVKDVMDDAYHNFMPAYQDYVLQSSSESETPVKFRARTYLVGNLGLPGGRRRKRRHKQVVRTMQYYLVGDCWASSTRLAFSVRGGSDATQVAGHGVNDNGVFQVSGHARPDKSGFDLLASNSHGSVWLRLSWEHGEGKDGDEALAGDRDCLAGLAESLDSPAPQPAQFRQMTDAEVVDFSDVMGPEDGAVASNAIGVTTDDESDADEEPSSTREASPPRSLELHTVHLGPSSPPPINTTTPSGSLASKPRGPEPPRLNPPPARRPASSLLPPHAPGTTPTASHGSATNLSWSSGMLPRTAPSAVWSPSPPSNSTVSPFFSEDAAPSGRVTSQTHLVRSDDLTAFLDSVGMPGFEQRFRDFGVTSLDDATSPFVVTDEDLIDDIGMSTSQVAQFRAGILRRHAPSSKR